MYLTIEIVRKIKTNQIESECLCNLELPEYGALSIYEAQITCK